MALPAGPALPPSQDVAPEPELPKSPGLELAAALLPPVPLAALAARLLSSFFLSLLAKKSFRVRSSVSAMAAVRMGGARGGRGARGSEFWIEAAVLSGSLARGRRGAGGRLPRALVLRSSPGTASVEQGRAGPAA